MRGIVSIGSIPSVAHASARRKVRIDACREPTVGAAHTVTGPSREKSTSSDGIRTATVIFSCADGMGGRGTGTGDEVNDAWIAESFCFQWITNRPVRISGTLVACGKSLCAFVFLLCGAVTFRNEALSVLRLLSYIAES